jgi:hypothetical protein
MEILSRKELSKRRHMDEIKKMDEEWTFLKTRVDYILHARDTALVQMIAEAVEEISMEGYGYPDPNHYSHLKGMFEALKEKTIEIIRQFGKGGE